MGIVTEVVGEAMLGCLCYCCLAALSKRRILNLVAVAGRGSTQKDSGSLAATSLGALMSVAICPELEMMEAVFGFRSSRRTTRRRSVESVRLTDQFAMVVVSSPWDGTQKQDYCQDS